MHVFIKEAYHEYESDFPTGWKFSSGDHFKFPVTIARTPCFIKRFEKKNPQQIPGYQLLVSLKGKNQANLPRVYGIDQVQENRKNVFYLFYNYSEGKTLEAAIQQGNVISLEKLCDDLFSALAAINQYQHWFPDFCEKNIFAEKGGKFILIDLDSAEHVTRAPDNDMDCSKDYWALVFGFCRDILKMPPLAPADISGISFNYLQAIFLLLRLKLFYAAGPSFYADTFDTLCHSLDRAGDELKGFFKKAFKEPGISFTGDEILVLKELILSKIIAVPVSHLQYILPEPPTADDEAKEVSTEEMMPAFVSKDDTATIAAGENIASTSSAEAADPALFKEAETGMPPEEEGVPALLEEEIWIEDFSIGNFLKKENEQYVVHSDDLFTLQWRVTGNCTLQLFRNGQLAKEIDRDSYSTSVKEAYVGSNKIITYTLHAFHGDNRKMASVNVVVAREEIIAVKETGTEKINNGAFGSAVVKPVPPNPLAKYLIPGVLALLALGFFIAHLFKQPAKEPIAVKSTLPAPAMVDSLTVKLVTAGDTILVNGKNLPANSDSVIILFKGEAGTILHLYNDRILVKVPTLKNSGRSVVDVVAYIHQSKFLLAQNLVIQNPVAIIPPDKKPVAKPVAKKALIKPVTDANPMVLEPNSNINFISRAEGQSLYIQVTNLLPRDMDDVKITVICDSVADGKDIPLKTEVVNFGKIKSNSGVKFGRVSDVLFKMYDRARSKKRLRLQASYK